MKSSRVVRHYICVVLLSALALAAGVGAPWAAETSAEQRAAQELESVRSDPLALRAFLKRMPKGADLHNHLNSAVYAETYIRLGGEDGLCVDPTAKAFTKSQPIKSGAEPTPACEAGDVPAADVPQNQALYNALVDSFSMRGFVPSEGVTAHDHFFGTSRQIWRDRSPPYRRVPARSHHTRRRAERAISGADGDAHLASAE